MARLLKLRRGTTSQHSSFTGAEGECTVDTTKDTLVVHDGSTAGGRPLLRQDLDNIGTGNVTHAMLAGDCIDGDNLADNAVDSEHYTDGSIDLAHMSANSVDSDQYVDGSIDHAHLANDCIDGDNIQDDAIDSEHITDGSIDLAHMSSQSVDEDNLYVSNSPTNGYVLTARSGANGGMTWEAAASGTPTDITVADESSDTTCFPLFVTAATGDLEPKTGSNLAFNSSSGALTATSFAGDGSALTGVAAASAGGSVYECAQTISSNYTMSSNKNGLSAGPITVSATVTIPSGSYWSIV